MKGFEFPSIPLKSSKPPDRRTGVFRHKKDVPLINDGKNVQFPQGVSLPTEQINQLDLFDGGFGTLVRRARQTVEKLKKKELVVCFDCGAPMRLKTVRLSKGRKAKQYECTDLLCPSKRE